MSLNTDLINELIKVRDTQCPYGNPENKTIIPRCSGKTRLIFNQTVFYIALTQCITVLQNETVERNIEWANQYIITLLGSIFTDVGGLL